MIFNLSSILRETMKQTNNKNKEDSNAIRKIPSSFLENKNKPTFPYNLKIDIELANRKSVELYKKYNTNTSIIPLPKFSILDLNKDLNKDLNDDLNDDFKKDLIVSKFNKTGLTIYGICGISVFAFLAYSYFTKRKML